MIQKFNDSYPNFYQKLMKKLVPAHGYQSGALPKRTTGCQPVVESAKKLENQATTSAGWHPAVHFYARP
jgi:hypothetical protein